MDLIDGVPSTDLARKRKRTAPNRFDDDCEEPEITQENKRTQLRHSQRKLQRSRTEASIRSPDQQRQISTASTRNYRNNVETPSQKAVGLERDRQRQSLARNLELTGLQ